MAWLNRTLSSFPAEWPDPGGPLRLSQDGVWGRGLPHPCYKPTFLISTSVHSACGWREALSMVRQPVEWGKRLPGGARGAPHPPSPNQDHLSPRPVRYRAGGLSQPFLLH